MIKYVFICLCVVCFCYTTPILWNRMYIINEDSKHISYIDTYIYTYIIYLLYLIYLYILIFLKLFRNIYLYYLSVFLVLRIIIKSFIHTNSSRSVLYIFDSKYILKLFTFILYGYVPIYKCMNITIYLYHGNKLESNSCLIKAIKS